MELLPSQHFTALIMKYHTSITAVRISETSRTVLHQDISSPTNISTHNEGTERHRIRDYRELYSSEAQE